jgi:hypothetical protein
MSQEELDRHEVIRRLIRKEVNGPKAAELLNLSPRQVRRLKACVRRNGARGIIHGGRGKPGNRAMPTKERDRIKRIVTARYPDFGPTHAAEKLAELHGIDRDPKTVRTIMTELKLWDPHPRHHDVHRSWRPRKDCFGEMEQFDGSYHHWLEDRYPDRLCLLLAIDDATGTITRACFAPHEGVFPVLAFWRDYCLTHGKPRSIYLDRFSTYRMTQRVATENHDTETQFQRACRELGIEPITAYSPEAKGRVERVFQTLQDRLVKEMRLKDISTVEAANRFLTATFIPWFNRRYAVIPAGTANLHRELRAGEVSALDAIFSRQETRVVRNDFTVSFKNQWYQLTSHQPVTVCKRDVTTIEERLDGTVRIRLRGKYVNFILLPERPQRASPTPWILVKTTV